MKNATLDIVNMVMNLAAVAGLLCLGLWARGRSRQGREDRAAIMASLRGIVREVGRLRMAERDSMELSKTIAEVRKRVAELPDEFEKVANDAHWSGYAACIEDQQRGQVLPFHR